MLTTQQVLTKTILMITLLITLLRDMYVQELQEVLQMSANCLDSDYGG